LVEIAAEAEASLRESRVSNLIQEVEEDGNKFDGLYNQSASDLTPSRIKKTLT
jgi:hypothetical protein